MAKLITWTDNFSVGYTEIDEQHKMLVGMINELYDAFTKGEAEEAAESIISEMIKYTDYHFKTEEKYFDKYDYSETEEHIKEHQNFVKQVTDFYNEFQKGSATVTYDIMSFLRNWLLEHIHDSDKKYSVEFKNKNFTEL